MSSPERLNVLLSRARDGLIMIGDIQTFTTARRGGELWTKLVEHLKECGSIYDGLPVICEQHPDRRSLLKTPANFDTDCPDGGCNRPWYAPPNFYFRVLTHPWLKPGLAELHNALLSVELSPTLRPLQDVLRLPLAYSLCQWSFTEVEVSRRPTNHLCEVRQRPGSRQEGQSRRGRATGAKRGRGEAVSGRNYTARRTVGEGQRSSEGQHTHYGSTWVNYDMHAQGY